MSGETPGQYGWAFFFLVLTALCLVGVVVTGAETLSIWIK